MKIIINFSKKQNICKNGLVVGRLLQKSLPDLEPVLDMT